MKIQPLIERFAATIKGYIDKRVGELDIQIKSLPTPKDGRDATDPTDEHLAALIAKQIPVPIPGKDGKSFSIIEASVVIEQAIEARHGAWASDFERRAQAVLQRSIDNIPLPKDGKDGRDGVDGKSFTAEEAKAMIDSAVTKAVQEEQKTWALDFERRAQELFQRAIERIPAPKDGKDGQDALEIDSFSAKLDDDGRTIFLEFVAGDTKKHAHLTLPIVLDRGVYNEKGPRENALYEKGDGVTFGGSFWISQVDDPQGKPGVSKDWRLAVKKGRDGKDTVHIPRDPNEPVKLR